MYSMLRALSPTTVVTPILYQGVSRRAILRFIYDAERSLGKFANDVLKANTVKCTEVPSTVMLALRLADLL